MMSQLGPCHAQKWQHSSMRATLPLKPPSPESELPGRCLQVGCRRAEEIAPTESPSLACEASTQPLPGYVSAAKRLGRPWDMASEDPHNLVALLASTATGVACLVRSSCFRCELIVARLDSRQPAHAVQAVLLHDTPDQDVDHA
ncbi:unnamed protein product [Polarella glacialis]|uniref:Uncharacterized protein n=1 Tax=Polarella glacialis TaxID=89957 RepID=A0A813DBK1_POLGL|nr:unnamed protein product [Polarella glacialis]